MMFRLLISFLFDNFEADIIPQIGLFNIQYIQN